MDNYKLTIISQMILRDVEEMFDEMSEMFKWIWLRQISLVTGYQRPHGFGSDKLALQRATNDHMDLVQTN
jgi:hypothetical protein